MVVTVAAFTYKPSLVRIDACNWVIVATDRVDRSTNTHIHKLTNRQDRLQYTAPQLARSVNIALCMHCMLTLDKKNVGRHVDRCVWASIITGVFWSIWSGRHMGRQKFLSADTSCRFVSPICRLTRSTRLTLADKWVWKSGPTNILSATCRTE